jgi:hypothetical protein
MRELYTTPKCNEHGRIVKFRAYGYHEVYRHCVVKVTEDGNEILVYRDLSGMTVAVRKARTLFKAATPIPYEPRAYA